MARLTTLSWLLVIILVTYGCSEEDSSPSPPTASPDATVKQPGSWSPYWSHLFHDGSPYPSANFIVYSDGASQETRVQTALDSETALADVKSIFSVTESDLDFPPNWGSRQIHILLDHNQWNRWGMAYRDGLTMRSKDSPQFDGDHERWQKVLQHEITHVIEFQLIGEFQYRQANTVWFREGIANYGARNHAIQTIEQLEEWRESYKDVPGQGHPIKIIQWSDFPQSVRDNFGTTAYYKMFELAVRYLLDEENGHGTSMEDAKRFYDDLGAGVQVETAFSKHFGITLQQYETSWWGLMQEYLDPK